MYRCYYCDYNNLVVTCEQPRDFTKVKLKSGLSVFVCSKCEETYWELMEDYYQQDDEDLGLFFDK
jgi:hypothetical protein